MTDAVEAIEGDPSELADGEIGADVAVPDENEVMAATAEASAAVDGILRLDEVFPAENGEVSADELPAEKRRCVAACVLIANGEEATDDAAEEKPNAVAGGRARQPNKTTGSGLRAAPFVWGSGAELKHRAQTADRFGILGRSPA